MRWLLEFFKKEKCEREVKVVYVIGIRCERQRYNWMILLLVVVVQYVCWGFGDVYRERQLNIELEWRLELYYTFELNKSKNRINKVKYYEIIFLKNRGQKYFYVFYLLKQMYDWIFKER